MHADAIEMAENMYFYRVLRNVFSPGMITIVSTPPSAPEVGGLDGSGGDTVEVIPVKKELLHHPCILNLYPHNRLT